MRKKRTLIKKCTKYTNCAKCRNWN